LEPNKPNYKTADEFREDVSRLGLNIPVSDDISVLLEPYKIGSFTLPNRIVFNPVEFHTATQGGMPTERSFEKYRQLSAGGFGTLWLEATAISNSCKSSETQFVMSDENLEAFKELVRNINDASKQSATGKKPYNVLQLTHSGRYTEKNGVHTPIVAFNAPILDMPGVENHIITDEELEVMEDEFVRLTYLSQLAGFDAVEFKACHGYLWCELLQAHTREGKYGGSYENRTRFMRNVLTKIKNDKRITVDMTVRINMFDAIAHPYGWCNDAKNHRLYDLTEMHAVMDELEALNVRAVNATMGNGYYEPMVNSPLTFGKYRPSDERLICFSNTVNACRELQQKHPRMPIVLSALSMDTPVAFNIAAGCINEGVARLAGFARLSVKYPDFPNKIYKKS